MDALTQELSHGFGGMSPAAHPVLDPVVVEADEFLVVDVGQRVVRSQLLDVFAVSCPFVVGGHYAVKWPVGGAAKRQADNHMTSVVLFKQ